MNREKTYTGTAFMGDPIEPRPVTLVVQDSIIIRVEDEKKAEDRWICPSFFNAHTHLADTVAMDLPCSGSLEELVTPPHGLKHRILAQTDSSHLIQAMRASVTQMIQGGVAGFADFREGGPAGVACLQQACENSPITPIILGRDGGEECGNGAGISSSRDIGRYAELAERMRAQGKIVAFHAGERDDQDIDAALACGPDLLVHCTHAAPRQIREIADAGIPVVICPRSNFLLGVTHSSSHPPIQAMIDAGVTLLIGTDNVMFVQPDIMQEISFTHTIFGTSPQLLLQAATRGFPPAGISHEIKEGNRANFFMVDVSKSNLKYSHDPVTSLTKRAPSGQICGTIFYQESK